MDDRLKHGFARVINKHHAAVQTDTELGLTDNWKLGKKAKTFWEDYRVASSEFMDLLERCDVREKPNA